MKRWYAAVACVAGAGLLGVLAFNTGTWPAASSAVVDVSWPNCKASHALYASGVVGVTGGLDFRANHCLAQETSWFATYDLYMNTGYPGDKDARKFQHTPLNCHRTDSTCLAYNYGYHAALYALNLADTQNIHSRRWWLDVETENSWTIDPVVNIADLKGAVQAVRQRDFLASAGFYSYPGQWQLLTGGWHNGLPAWAATGETDRASAVTACGEPSFTGGPIVLTQYTPRLDQNIVCKQ